MYPAKKQFYPALAHAAGEATYDLITNIAASTPLFL
jgi:hypothetical protein